MGRGGVSPSLVSSVVAVVAVLTSPLANASRTDSRASCMWPCLLAIGAAQESERASKRATELAPRHVRVACLLPTYSSVEVGRRLVVGAAQHRDDRHEDRLDRVHRQPSLGSLLIAPLVLARWVQDRDANIARLPVH